MRTHQPENERIKRAYFIYLKEARRLSEHSIDAAAAALSRFEAYTRYRDFKRFHIEQAMGFKRKLANRSANELVNRSASARCWRRSTRCGRSSTGSPASPAIDPA